MNKIRFLTLTVSLTLLSCAGVRAQSATPLPAASASAPAGKPGPRLLTPEEKRDNATPADNARPEGTVTPQINIPLGQKPTAPLKLDKHRDSSSRRTAPAAIDDTAARCSALVDPVERANCLDHQGRDHARP